MPVIDASVIIKWFVNETDSDAALALRDAHKSGETQLIAPDLLIYEVANVLLHHPRFMENEIAKAVHSLYDIQLEIIVPTAELVQVAVHLASRHKLTLYDALYLGMARELGVELITADHKLQRKANLPFVHLL